MIFILLFVWIKIVVQCVIAMLSSNVSLENLKEILYDI